MHSDSTSVQETHAPSISNEISADTGSEPMDRDLLEAVLGYSTPIHCPTGHTVISHGEQEPFLLYIQKGTVAVSREEGQTRIVVALISSGNFIGEIGFFDGVSRVREARAIDEVEAARFDHAALDRILQERPQLFKRFTLHLTRSICWRFRRLLEDREPLKGYAAALSGGKRATEPVRPLPDDFFFSRIGKETSRMVETFKASMFDLSYRLQAETGMRPSKELMRMGFVVLDQFKAKLEEISQTPIDTEIQPYIWGYIFKEIFPYFMRSRFAERVYYKPQGYAGDYMMIDMIYNNTPKGDGKLGELVDAWALEAKAPEAVRGRRRLLADQLNQMSRSMNGKGRPLAIMNLACGPCRELTDFLSGYDLERELEFLLVDIDDEALQYADRQLKPFSHKAKLTFVSENILKWAVGRSKQDFGLQDIIYSSGLTDYLEDRYFIKLVDRCYERLNTGGTLLVGNFGPRNPDRAFMDYILEWKLIYRSESDLKDLFSRTRFGANIEVLAEPLGVNIFIKGYK